MANEVISLQLAIEASNAARTVGEVKKSFKDLNEAIKQAEIGTKEYDQAVFALAKQKDKLMDLRQEINLLNPKDKIQAFVGLTSSIAGGFAAAQGAVALFAGENEDLQKVLVKTQAAVALATGVQQLKEFGRSWELINMIMRNNPILMIVAAVAALTAGIIALTRSTGENTEAIKLNKEETEKLRESQRGLVEDIDAANEAYLRGTEKITDADSQRFKAYEKYNDDLTKLDNERLAHIKKLNEEIGVEDSWNIDTKLKRQQELNRRISEYDNVQAENKKQIERRLAEEIDSIQQVAFAKDKKSRDAEAERKREDAKKEAERKAKEEIELMRSLANDSKQFLIEMTNSLNAELAQLNRDARAKEQLEREQAGDLEVEGYLRRKELRAQILIEQIEGERQLAAIQIDIARGVADTLAHLAGESETIANIAFIIDKAAAIASIVVNTQKEISGYYANAALNPTNAIPGGQAINLARASGLALAAKVRAGVGIASILAASIAKFKGGGGGGINTPSIGGTKGGGGVTPPTVQQPQSGLTLLNPDGSVRGGTGDQTIKAYVVESELRGVQNRVGKIERNASF